MNGDEFKKLNETAKKSWKEWTSVLNELKVNIDKWKQIKVDSDKTLQEVREKSSEFEKKLLMNEFDSKNEQVEFFEKAQIERILRKRVRYI